jgi:hypothetical protein
LFVCLFGVVLVSYDSYTNSDYIPERLLLAGISYGGTVFPVPYELDLFIRVLRSLAKHEGISHIFFVDRQLARSQLASGMSFDCPYPISSFKQMLRCSQCPCSCCLLLVQPSQINFVKIKFFPVKATKLFFQIVQFSINSDQNSKPL